MARDLVFINQHGNSTANVLSNSLGGMSGEN